MSEVLRFHLLGSSHKFQEIRSQIEKVARIDAAVMITGETGTGKEMAARAIHYLGERSKHPFIPVNCGAIPESLIESELFGHERGAFTDAKSASPGLVSEAEGGTLFLDEIDALSLKAQAAVLRFLQDNTYRRVGSSVQRQANVRIITASNADFNRLISMKSFRDDLLYRINVLTIRMPALREREGDALELANVFLKRFSHQYKRPFKTLHPDSVDHIIKHAWPGNIRELENVIHREFLMCDTAQVQFGRQATKESCSHTRPFKNAKAHAIAEFERAYLYNVLEKASGNLSEAARMAGQERSAFGKLARKYGMQAPLLTTAGKDK